MVWIFGMECGTWALFSLMDGTTKRHKKMETMPPLKPHKMKMKSDELPFSLIESEILPRIPAKSDIGRCRCVCKQWNSFLSTPTFARTHLHRHRTITDYNLLLFDDQPPALFRTLPLNQIIPSKPNPNPNPNPVFILASLDGLVCLGSKGSSQLVFWNPLTRAYKKLSSCPIYYFSNCFAGDAIGFYINSSNDYKLVCLFVGGLLGAYIYSHRLDSWREVEFLFAYKDYCVWSPPTLCGQCLYFTVTAYTERLWWIICFDVNTETFRKIRFPSVPDGATDYCGSLVVLNEHIHLCLSYIKLNMRLKQGDLWRMDGDGDDGWVKVAAFSDPMYNDLMFTRQHICTAASTGNWIAVLDQEKNSFKKVNVEDFTTHYKYFCSPSFGYRSSRMIYVQSLVSPNP